MCLASGDIFRPHNVNDQTTTVEIYFVVALVENSR